MNLDYQQLIEIAVHASLDAGTEILNVYNSEDFDVRIKADKSPLTEADTRSHEKIMSHLKDTGIPVLSEEGKDIAYADRKNRKQFWLVDPLDGTKEFIKRNGEFTVNIALVENNRVTLGVIYVPYTKTLYFGGEGKGSHVIFEVDENMHINFDHLVSQGKYLPLKAGDRDYTVVASRSHSSPETEAFIEDIRADFPHLQLVSKGSSLKICMVAEGVADVYPRFAPTMEWDTAAGHAILKGAGGNMYEKDTEAELQYGKENLLNPHFIAR
ncbi:MAG: 3'(2'),5'-bisphosphate nucleotidase CysQ [Bacteroidetes bacterium]|jgi:3'(2'), 5'-bisphosphate nucleotidase|nr:3'(2'),5'-bisphosphate nucleotidase CysQ [Bacteroidota bacterium]